MGKRADHDARVKATPDYYTAVVFLGRARFERVRDLPSLEAARKAGVALAVQHGCDTAMIYAVKGVNDAHVENINVAERKR